MPSLLYVIPSQVFAMYLYKDDWLDQKLVILFKGGESLTVSDGAVKHYNELLPKIEAAHASEVFP